MRLKRKVVSEVQMLLIGSISDVTVSGYEARPTLSMAPITPSEHGAATSAQRDQNVLHIAADNILLSTACCLLK